MAREAGTGAAGEFDYIVIGSGSSGAVIAARLSENPRVSVALLEAGSSNESLKVHIPLAHPMLYVNPRFNWMLESEPEPGLNGRTTYQPRGRTLGGTSSINGMLYIRGNRRDYDRWRQMGCVGWSYDDILPFFRKAENNKDLDGEFHGKSGPLHVERPNYANPLVEAGKKAFAQAGFSYNPDFNGAEQDGYGPYQLTTRNGWRDSVATAYLKPARNRPNLHVLTGHTVKRILFEGRRTAGVEVEAGGRDRVFRARRETVLSAGAFHSPAILQLSGIGPGELLGTHGITVVHALRGVGAELQDHFWCSTIYECSQRVTLNEVYGNLPQRVLAGLQYFTRRRGPLAIGGSVLGCFARSDPRLDQPDFQIHLGMYGMQGRTQAGLLAYPFPAFSLSPVHIDPACRGSVAIRSGDYRDKPVIRFNYLKDPSDMEAMKAGLRIARRVSQQPALKDFFVREVKPGPGHDDDAALEAFVRDNGMANLHPAGTCRMGERDDAVVDSRLRVHGIEGLRVADASIMPRLIQGNTNAPCIMIGEKAAVMIGEDAR